MAVKGKVVLPTLGYFSKEFLKYSSGFVDSNILESYQAKL